MRSADKRNAIAKKHFPIEGVVTPSKVTPSKGKKKKVARALLSQKRADKMPVYRSSSRYILAFPS